MSQNSHEIVILKPTAVFLSFLAHNHLILNYPIYDYYRLIIRHMHSKNRIQMRKFWIK